MSRILDGCCGLGGATRGYVNAGHTVTGVDIVPQPSYRKSGGVRFIQQDILDVLRCPVWLQDSFDFIHLSPPCQGEGSRMSNCRPGLAEKYQRLISPARELLDATGLPYVIENPVGAPLKNPVMLCMYMFGREAYRHRLFEAGGGFTLKQPPLPAWPVFGPVKECGWPHPVKAAKAGHWKSGMFVSVAGHERIGPMRHVMEIDWGNRDELAEAIPPYFSQWIGEQLRGVSYGTDY